MQMSSNPAITFFWKIGEENNSIIIYNSTIECQLFKYQLYKHVQNM